MSDKSARIPRQHRLMVRVELRFDRRSPDEVEVARALERAAGASTSQRAKDLVMLGYWTQKEARALRAARRRAAAAKITAEPTDE